MELKIMSEEPGITLIALVGKLDVQGEGEIGEDFRRLLENRDTSFLVDMSKVDYLASLGIRLLFAGAKSLASRGLKMVITSPQPMVEETLLNSGTARLIKIAATRSDALELVRN